MISTISGAIHAFRIIYKHMPSLRIYISGRVFVSAHFWDSGEAESGEVIRVLHVDDDPSILEISKQILMDMGSFEIDNASCVDEAFQKLKKQPYDAVISDFEMPQKDGLSFLSELREQKNVVPFVLFTGKGREDVASRALNLGAEGYFHKQGDPETVYGELARGIRVVSDRAKAKLAVARSEKRFSTIMEQAAQVIFVHNDRGMIVDVNLKACKSLGYTKEELLSMNMPDFFQLAIDNNWVLVHKSRTAFNECT